MWLENINKNIENITELAKPEFKGEVNKQAKEIRDKTIIKTISEFKKGVLVLKHRHSKNIEKPFKEISDESSLHDLDVLIHNIDTDIEKAVENIKGVFRPEMQGEIEKILKDTIEETIIETTFEFQKGVESLHGHISKNIDN